MISFREKFIQYCKEKGTSPHLVAQDVGVDTSLVSSWINGRRTPKPETMMEMLQKFAKSDLLDVDFATLSSWWAADFIPPEAFEKGAQEFRQRAEERDRRSS